MLEVANRLFGCSSKQARSNRDLTRGVGSFDSKERSPARAIGAAGGATQPLQLKPQSQNFELTVLFDEVKLEDPAPQIIDVGRVWHAEL